MVAERNTTDPTTPSSTTTTSDGHSNARVLGLLFLFSMLMFSMPFGAFYLTKYVLLTYWHVNGFVNTVWSVVAAVGTMYVIILTYAYKAYIEDRHEIGTQHARNQLNKQE